MKRTRKNKAPRHVLGDITQYCHDCGERVSKADAFLLPLLVADGGDWLTSPVVCPTCHTARKLNGGKKPETKEKQDETGRAEEHTDQPA